MKVLFAVSIIAAVLAISPASAAMMARTGENIAKSVAAVDTMPDGPRKMAMMKEIGMANTAMSKGDMRSACKSFIAPRIWVRSKAEGLYGAEPAGSRRRVSCLDAGARARTASTVAERNEPGFPEVRWVVGKEKENAMAKRSSMALALVAVLISPISASAQGSMGTGSTSTGIGAPVGPAGPGIRSKGWTQQPAAATNTATTGSTQTLPPPPRNAIPKDARVYHR